MSAPTFDTTAIATRIVYELLGKRWVPPMHAVDAYPVARSIHLSGRPATLINSITGPDGAVLDPSWYKLYSRFEVRFGMPAVIQYSIDADRQMHGRRRLGFPFGSGGNYSYGGYPDDPFSIGFSDCLDREFVIDYNYGSQPTQAIAQAISTYACEMDKAIAGENCKLPERVTNVTRQGMSITILDPMDFVDKGLTGVPEVDTLVMIFNPPTGGKKGAERAKAPARLFTDRNPPARRISVEAL